MRQKKLLLLHLFGMLILALQLAGCGIVTTETDGLAAVGQPVQNEPVIPPENTPTSNNEIITEPIIIPIIGPQEEVTFSVKLSFYNSLSITANLRIDSLEIGSYPPSTSTGFFEIGEGKHNIYVNDQLVSNYGVTGLNAWIKFRYWSWDNITFSRSIISYFTEPAPW